MPVNHIAIDGLWRCLCPSIDQITISIVRQSILRKKLSIPHRPRAIPPNCLSARQFSTTNVHDDTPRGVKIKDRVRKNVYIPLKSPPNHIGGHPKASNLPIEGQWQRCLSDNHKLYPTPEENFARLIREQNRAPSQSRDGKLAPLSQQPCPIGTQFQHDLEESGKLDALVEMNGGAEIQGENILSSKLKANVNLEGSGVIGSSLEGTRTSRNASTTKENPRPAEPASHVNLAQHDDGLRSVLERLFGDEEVLSKYTNARSKDDHGTVAEEQDIGASELLGKQSPVVTQFQKSHGTEPAMRNDTLTPEKRKGWKPLSFINQSFSGPSPQIASNSSFFTPVRLVNTHTSVPLSRKIRKVQAPMPFANVQSGDEAFQISQSYEKKPWKPIDAEAANANSDPRKKGVLKRLDILLWKREGWDSDEIPTLHDRLRACWTGEGQYGRVVALVEYLLLNRGEASALVHYSALIRANSDAEQGSAASVRALLQEMKELGLKGDSGLYHAALQALAVHPDYDLRTEIIQEMKERWFGLSPEGWHSLVAGLLRDRQLEVALDQFEQMQTDGIVIQPWLYDTFTYMLCELGEIHEAYKMFLYRYEHSRFGISVGHWEYLLDKFSDVHHYDATKLVWDTRVQFANLTPSDGTCVAVLNIASQNADPALATSVIKVLSARQTPLSTFHYEALIAAYIGIADVRTAFRVLAIMEKAGLEPSTSSTRAIYASLSTSARACQKSWETLKSLREEGQIIPLAAVNVVLEALIKIGNHDDVFEYYKSLHEICPRGPNTETINTMLQGIRYLRQNQKKERAMFLASEMQALKIKPDMLTYDRLILACLSDPDYEDAFRYLEEMEEIGRDSVENNRTGWWMRAGTATILVKVCINHADQRAFKILKEMESRGMAIPSPADLERKWGSALKEAKPEDVNDDGVR